MMKRVAIGVGLAGLFIVGSFAGYGIVFGASPTPDLTLRGNPVDRDSFSLSELISPDDEALVQDVNLDLMKQCMKEKGYEYPRRGSGEAGDNKYLQAVTGDDGTAVRPPAGKPVKLPNGETFVVGASWTPDSCYFKADAALGSDSFYREALRLQMLGVRAKANRELIKDAAFSQARTAIGRCKGGDVDPGTVVAALERPIRGAPQMSQPRLDSDTCYGTVGGVLRTLRARYDYDAAADEPELVAAWVELRDREVAAARSLRGRS